MKLGNLVLFAIWPGLGLWAEARRHSEPDTDWVFTRRPSVLDLWHTVVVAAVLVGGILASSTGLMFIGSCLVAGALIHLSLRLFAPRGWFRTRAEYYSATTLLNFYRLFWYSLFAWVLIQREWISVIVLGTIMAVLVILESLALAGWSHLLRPRKHHASIS